MDFRSVVLLKVLLFIQFSSLDCALNPNMLAASQVVGGTRSARGSFPYMVALTSENKEDPDSGDRVFLCSGILVSLKAIITGASCIEVAYDPDKTPNLDPTLQAVVGTNQWNPGLCSGAESYDISQNVSYPGYQPPKTNDLGILFTVECVKITPRIHPIYLDFDYVDAGVRTKIAGWGANSKNGDYSKDLYELQMITLENNDCQAKASSVSKSFTINPDLEICVFNSSTTGACYGDTGAPLVRTDRETVVGMVTWGFPCAVGGPDIALRFSACKEWILQTAFNDFFLNKPSGWKAVGKASTSNALWCL